jgi:hypothetical protein
LTYDLPSEGLRNQNDNPTIVGTASFSIVGKIGAVRIAARAIGLPIG